MNFQKSYIMYTSQSKIASIVPAYKESDPKKITLPWSTQYFQVLLSTHCRSHAKSIFYLSSLLRHCWSENRSPPVAEEGGDVLLRHSVEHDNTGN